ATRQEVFFFGTPPGDARFTEEALPVWSDHANHFMYGIPGNEWRGFKVADDARGPAFDPTAGERVPSPEALRSARDYLAFRFPALKDAPLVEARVCQYENSPDAIPASRCRIPSARARGSCLSTRASSRRTPPPAWRSSFSRRSSRRMRAARKRWPLGRFTRPGCGWSGARLPTAASQAGRSRGKDAAGTAPSTSTSAWCAPV